MARVLRLLPVLALAIGTVFLGSTATASPAAHDSAPQVGTNGYTWSN
ncbi:hypothetical protein AB0425_10735 [Actinosynnema sp. NPDC051121]|nr:hypothetical protein [Saccharothrix sp.]